MGESKRLAAARWNATERSSQKEEEREMDRRRESGRARWSTRDAVMPTSSNRVPPNRTPVRIPRGRGRDSGETREGLEEESSEDEDGEAGSEPEEEEEEEETRRTR